MASSAPTPGVVGAELLCPNRFCSMLLCYGIRVRPNFCIQASLPFWHESAQSWQVKLCRLIESRAEEESDESAD